MNGFSGDTQYAKSELNKRRLLNFEIDEQNKAILIQSIPELSNINSEIASFGLELIKCSLAGGDEKNKQSVEQKLQQLRERKQQLIAAANVDASIKNPHFHCKVCKDTGKVNGQYCECFKKLMSDQNRKKVSESSNLSLCSFDDFSLSYYSDQIDQSLDISPKELMDSNLKTCKDFADSFLPNSDENFLMIGNAGLGKTHLALSIANTVIEKGHSCLYSSVSNILKQIEKEYFDMSHTTETLSAVCSVDLLILDDLGTEFNNAFITGTLYDIINTRLIKRLSTIITTNILDESMFAVRYGEKISSRLVGCYTTIPFVGKDIRLIKNDM